MQKLGISWESVTTRANLVRAKVFSAGHRYFNPELSELENQRTYGKLYRKDGFGHNFRVEASVSGPIDRESGMIINLTDIDRLLTEVLGKLDHFYLNDLNLMSPVTLETITQWIGDELSNKLNEFGVIQLERIRVYEGDHTWLDYLPS